LAGRKTNQWLTHFNSIMIYKFNNKVIDSESFKLWSDDSEIPVEPKVFNLIVYLIEHADKVVSRDELLDQVWQGRVVSDTSINNSIKSARKVLGDDGTKQHIIKTIHSRGYQFVAKLNTDTVTNPSISIKTESNRNQLLPVIGIVGAVLILLYLGFRDQPNHANSKATTTTPEVDHSIDNTEVKNETALTTQQLIAVLPFANNKPDKDTDYLGFALANQIISDLTHLEEYAIRPAGSIRKYVNQVIDAIAVGKELDVNFVISGNYLLENNIVRLNVEMIEVNNNQLVWRETMQVNYSDTFNLQDMVAQQVAKALDVGFRDNYLNQQFRDIPNSALAYEYYLRGISYPQSNEGHKLAVEMLQKSIELDPEYAPSYAHLGFHRRLLEQHGRIVPTGMKTGEWYYLNALKLNPLQLDALSNLSALYVETNRMEDALLVTRKMLKINPNDANSHFALGYIFRYAGMLDEAIEEMETALSISPNNTRFRSIISTYVSAGRYQDALDKVYLDPGDYGTGYSGIIAFNQEQYDLAGKLFNQVLSIDENGIWGLISKVYLAYMIDDKELGLKTLAKMVESDITDAENMYYFADFYALFKEKEPCLMWLEKAVNTGYFNYPHISKNDAFSFVQNDKRYIAALKLAKEKHDAFRTKFL